MLNSYASLPFSCLSRRVLAGALVLAAYAPQIAEACSPPQPELYSTVPADGATYPGNAALLFSGFDLSLDGVTVTVDGQPAQFVPAEFAAGWAQIAVLVEPMPAAGQEVIVSGIFCDPEFCGPMKMTYTAAAPDLTAPAPDAEQAFFTVYNHGDFVSSGGDCQGDADLTLYMHYFQGLPVAEEASVVMRASWPGADGMGGFSDFMFATGEEASLSLPLTLFQLGGKDPVSEVCLTVSAIDTANNAAPPFQVCPACFYRKDDTEVDSSYQPEPVWSDADAVPGSKCEVAQETTGIGPTTGDTGDTGGTGGTGDATGATDPTGEPDTGNNDTTPEHDTMDRGCACASDGGSRDLGGLVLMALGLGLARRRESAAASR